MNKSFIHLLAIVSVPLLLTGCAGPNLSLGSGSKTVVEKPTLGQQLIDLKKAEDSGAITPSEYQSQKDRLLQGN
ncbi:MAG TPA: hypothetical protein VGN23_03250 [Verrucomicrobiae bacterium]|jgi:hypothetical protein